MDQRFYAVVHFLSASMGRSENLRGGAENVRINDDAIHKRVFMNIFDFPHYSGRQAATNARLARQYGEKCRSLTLYEIHWI